ncbi:HlyD family secretion protein [Methylocystis sp. MJC1]|jgi:membrane fusion protein (multidrug efflux system)|uniref:HlyD family secretion protein n=1 Tax=Methylocystis sp. MJC1 TaxID=2654282 RepID=UPI0013EA223E|nr:HlyD family secretion protein [Methylocystis sp. MJC1]KAF2991228.1 Multidrug export protein EmrA [Methylocystis sp. MJC1]MBU6526232.1 HlyD family secretion protein [Methylocystis sp. MJC1]UZX12686.1 HlyD family secretion protein [Methylocystis sp. MJC1]
MAEATATISKTERVSPAGRLVTAARRRLRLLLMAGVPALAGLAGVGLYLSGGRYISTDNAYVGAQKVLITPDISGKVSRVLIREGQHVGAGDELFDIDPVPFQLVLRQAQSKLETVRTDFATLKSNYKSLSRLIELGEQAIGVKRRMFDRKAALASRQFSTQSDVDNASTALLAAELQLQPVRQQLTATLNQLQGNPDLTIEDYAPYRQAKAALDQAQRDLDHTIIKAPISGVATQVDNIQLGRFVTAGAAIFSVVDDAAPWVDANPKETDITHLRVGQAAALHIDTFPGQSFHGHVASVGPGTGAQFAILPPQNANGNWVKVVQRVPVRIEFDAGQRLSALRAGMSVTVEIDTRRQRGLASLFGAQESYAEEQAK